MRRRNVWSVECVCHMVTAVSPVETAEPIAMPFDWKLARVQVTVHIGAVRRTQLRSKMVAMRAVAIQLLCSIACSSVSSFYLPIQLSTEYSRLGLIHLTDRIKQPDRRKAKTLPLPSTSKTTLQCMTSRSMLPSHYIKKHFIHYRWWSPVMKTVVWTQRIQEVMWQNEERMTLI